MQTPSDNTQTLGRYQLNSLLGVGGTSKVYLAKDPELNREVAIKCFDLQEGDTDKVERIEREAVLSAQLNHSNIVQMYDVVKTDHTLGLVMEYAQGATLSEKLKQGLPNQTQALSWLTQIAEGLNKAHQSGIIHCDLKLDNIIVNIENVAKIADFGIGKAVAHDKLGSTPMSDAQLISGSYLSVSPEQAQGKKLDFRTDVFSFGILAYQLLTGRHPFGASKDQQTIMHRIVNDRFEFSASDSQSIPQPLLQLISALLEKKPEDRPANMASVSATLQQILDLQIGVDEYDDQTVMFEAVKPNRFWQTPLFRKASYGLGLFFIGVGIFFAWPKTPVKTIYVAITNPTIKAAEGFDPDFKRQIVTTLKTSLQEGLINLEHINLIADSNIEAYDGDIPAFAKAVAADAILKVSADCSRTQCQVSLQKLGGNEWTVEEFQEWPVVTESLTDIRSTTLDAFSKIFTSEQESNSGSSIDELVYRDYLEISKASGTGSDASVDLLSRLEKIRIQAPAFAPIYGLYKKLAINLYSTNGNSTHLQTAIDMIERAPLSISQSSAFLEYRFDLVLAQGKIREAEQVIERAAKLNIDRVVLNGLKADLAYRQSNYKTAVILERKNVLLRPSFDNFYNLAISEFTLGNMNLARQSIQRALSISPENTDAHNLLATISLNEGDIDAAISSYMTLVEKSPDNQNLANLGLSLMLKGSYVESIEYQKRALEYNPKNPLSLTNLADSYNLNGQVDEANEIYNQILELTDQSNELNCYHCRAQALAHLGSYNKAIKTLQLAKEKNTSTLELTYSAAIVHSIAGNHSAAIVEVENSIKEGTGSIWFQLEWFKELCSYPKFIELIGAGLNNLCSPAPSI